MVALAYGECRHQAGTATFASGIPSAAHGRPGACLISANPQSETPDPDPAPAATFADLGVRPETVASLTALGIIAPFAIQALAVPLALTGADVIGQARTGTGKTLAFGIPLLERVEAGGTEPQALVVVPTRELCVQVAGDLERAGESRGVRVLAIYGGRAYEPQTQALGRGVDVVVGTPGRLLDLAQQHHLSLAGIRMLVLDEADEMLDLGFLPDVERILALTPAEGRQTMLFSATVPGPVITLARRFMRQPTHVRAEAPSEGRTVPTTAQHVLRAHAMDKVEMLARILQARDRGLTMVFCRTKRTCDRVAEDLAGRGFAAAAVHGDLGQGQREQALRAFRSGKVDVLVATDVAARGIDVGGVTHVVNYQCPEDETVYLHRIGRTGRAGGSGVAVTFVDWDDIPRWNLINKALALPFEDPVETYSTSPQLYESLDIPSGAKGTLPRAAQTRAGLAAEELQDVGETGRRRTPRNAPPPTNPTATRGPRQRTRGGTAGARSGPITMHPAAPTPPGPSAAGEPPTRRRRRGGRGRGRESGTDSAATAESA
ncbi:MAG: DEAD/DEAH box helicase [Mycobacteriales bacterium]